MKEKRGWKMKIETEVDISSVRLREEEIIYFVSDKILDETQSRNKYVTANVFRLLEDIDNPNLSMRDAEKERFFREHFDSITLEDLESIVNSK